MEMITWASVSANPIPSFALGKPALSANLSVVKGRFSYDPQLSYDLHLKPWIIDNWFHYKLVDKSLMSRINNYFFRIKIYVEI